MISPRVIPERAHTAKGLALIVDVPFVSTSDAAAGGSDDFARGILNIPYAYTIELPDYGGYNFLLPPSFIPRVGEQMWTAVNVFVDHMK